MHEINPDRGLDTVDSDPTEAVRSLQRSLAAQDNLTEIESGATAEAQKKQAEDGGIKSSLDGPRPSSDELPGYDWQRRDDGGDSSYGDFVI